MDRPTDQADLEQITESDLPRIAGRRDHDQRLALIIWPPSFLGPLPSGPIDPELVYRNGRAHAEVEFSERFDRWEKHSKSDSTRPLICEHRTDIRADALIAADLNTWCCSFMCQVLEYYADYLLDRGKAGEDALRDLDQFADNLASETHDHKWLPGLQAIGLSEVENADAFCRRVRETFSGVRRAFGRLAWNVERQLTDEVLFDPRLNADAGPNTTAENMPQAELVGRATPSVDDLAPSHPAGQSGSVGPQTQPSETWPSTLRKARSRAGLSRPGLAHRLKSHVKITAEAIKKHEEGKAKPRPAVRSAYAEVYGTSEAELFGE